MYDIIMIHDFEIIEMPRPDIRPTTSISLVTDLGYLVGPSRSDTLSRT